jgi:hypothetical protein
LPTESPTLSPGGNGLNNPKLHYKGFNASGVIAGTS